MLSAIEREELHLAVAQVFLPEQDDPSVLARRVFPTSPAVRRPGLLFKSSQEILLETGKPFVEGLAGNAEVPGGEGHVFVIFLPENDPFEAAARAPGKPLQPCDSPPAVVLLPEPVPPRKIPRLERRPEPALLPLLPRQNCCHE